MTLVFYVLAALGEIFGCFTFWMWLRGGKSAFWLFPGALSLAFFAFLLTRTDAAFAGRAFAAYGGIYIVISLVWGWKIEKMTLDRSDILGALLCLAGAFLILFGPHEGR